MITGTFNGADIVAWPVCPAVRQIERVASDRVAASTSPYTGSQQMQWWPGGDGWAWNVTLPQLSAGDAAVWEAFLLELRGMKNVFQLGDPRRRSPQGIASGQPVTFGAQPAMSATLSTAGWTPKLGRQLLPSDHLQIGKRLYLVLDVVNADTNGRATFGIWPTLREPVDDGTPIVLANPKGIFRLASNMRSITANETRLTALMTIKCVEAR